MTDVVYQDYRGHESPGMCPNRFAARIRIPLSLFEWPGRRLFAGYSS
jgi:hypothetical protein